MALSFVEYDNVHHCKNLGLMMELKVVDDRLDEEEFVDVHHWNYSLLYHQVLMRLFSFLMEVLLFVERSQAKKKKEFKSTILKIIAK
jgi:hypothetical protein